MALTSRVFKHASSSSNSFVALPPDLAPLEPQFFDCGDALVRRQLRPELTICDALLFKGFQLSHPTLHDLDLIAPTIGRRLGPQISRFVDLAAVVNLACLGPWNPVCRDSLSVVGLGFLTF